VKALENAANRQSSIDNRKSPRSPWYWIPTLYFGEGLPYVIVMTVSVIMYKRLGLSNQDIAFYTSWLYLPWVIKPLWSPVVDILRTKRFWIVAMQLLVGVSLAGVAFTIPTTSFIQTTLAIFWLMAFSSATHDIAADGFYMLALNDKEQSFFVGIRSTFYRIASISGQGLLVILAGYLEHEGILGLGGNIVAAWSITFFVIAGLFILVAVYHQFILPYPASDASVGTSGFAGFVREFFKTFAAFFTKDSIGLVISFLLLFRLGEAQLVKMVSPFLLDGMEKGGLGLTTEQVGFVYGTMGILALTLGGLSGGFVVAKKGLRYWLWPMVLIIHLPDLVFVYLSAVQPSSLWVITAGVAVEQFGYGFGFTAYMMYMIYVSRGSHSTAHYALCTGFMAMGMMLPGMASGWIQSQLGYVNFFVWVFLATIPSFILARLVTIDPEFGKKGIS